MFYYNLYVYPFHVTQHHGQQLLQQSWANQPISPRDSASLQHSNSYNHTQHSNRYSYHSQGDPIVPSKFQQGIIQGEFIDLSELLQADFQFKYASIEANNAFTLIHKDETVLMWPRKKGKLINSPGTRLSSWVLYEQVMVYVYPQKYYELAYYRKFIMQQDKKLILSAVQMYDIRFWAMCTHHSCPFTTMDQALMAIILDATVVKTLACKCFRCGGFDHLVDGHPFPQASLLEMAEMTNKGIQVRQTAKSGLFKSTSPIQTDKWFHNGREGCSNY